MIIRVFDVGNNIEENSIEENQKHNILQIFSHLLNENHLVTYYYLDEQAEEFHDSPIHYLSNSEDEDGLNFESVAHKLLDAELKKDGTRNSTIKEGLLFIKMELNTITIMKLEKLSVIDKETYALKKELGSEKDYFKACIFDGDFSNIKVIDKNRTAAKYWFDKFLGLKKKRTDEDNTKDLIDLIQSNKFFSDDIIQNPNFRRIKNNTEFYLIHNYKFDKSEFIIELINKGIVSVKDENDFFSDESMMIDSEFNLSRKVIDDAYKIEIQPSEGITIKSKNYLHSIADNEMYFDEDDKMIKIPISQEYLEKVKGQFKRE